MKPFLNIGCGNFFNVEWENIDTHPFNDHVKKVNIKDGLPYASETFDVVYHSHVLEHLDVENGRKFISECYRVLKKGGIIRIAVPDLEGIAKEYLKQLELAESGEERSVVNHYWMVLEMLDQGVRNYSGGKMGEYLLQENIPNREFLIHRFGAYFLNLEKVDVGKKGMSSYQNRKSSFYERRIKYYIRPSTWKEKLKRYVFKEELEMFEKTKKLAEIGHFRVNSGECHYFMYDRLSLKILLSKFGFRNFKVVGASESSIPNWEKFNLDIVDGLIRKPDSIFVEAIK